jgi:aldose sugar dehydrogenase
MRSIFMHRPLACLAAAVLASTPALAQDRTVSAEAGQLNVRLMARGLDHPWGLALLPDGRMLVTERPGRLRVVNRDGNLSQPLAGLPRIVAQQQGGLLDVALDPSFASNQLVYFSFVEPGDGGTSTAVARGRFADTRLDDVRVVFSQRPKMSNGLHFGSRLAFTRDGKLFITTGDRFQFDPAQDLGSHLGKVIRINLDGTAPQDNPFAGRQGARPEIWSYGHRNIQGAAIHPQTGALWIHEMGPRGGDELNIAEAGKNFGWPLVSWGDHYDGKPIPKPPTRPEFAQSVRYWNPVIAPSGMVFYTADLIAPWKGSLLIGGLRSQGIVRLTLDGARVTNEERISLGSRTRDVRQGPDGAVYALTDETDGKILRLAPR